MRRLGSWALAAAACMVAALVIASPVLVWLYR